MNHGSLFSGIGGFDLAAEWMGWNNVFHCEWNEFGQKVLKYYWPNAISYGDITKTDFSKHRGAVDILTGGFPCQPYSTAGKRKGKEDDRHLWPEMLRAIREIKPRWIVGENVLGLVNWSDGLVFEEVQIDLEVEGYKVQPYVLPAVSKNAPHRRDRVWFVGYASSNRWTRKRQAAKKENRQQERLFKNRELERGLERLCSLGVITNPSSKRQPRQRRPKGQINSEKERDWQEYRAVDDGRWPTQSPVCYGDDGISARLDGITLSNWRKESIKAGGNAIVPQVVYEIFKTIEEYERL